MKTPSYRPLKVAGELQAALLDVIHQAVQWDPLLAGVCLTVVSVKMTPDLKQAFITLADISYLHKEITPDRLIRLLKPHVARMRYLLAQKISLKYVPFLIFPKESSKTFALQDILQKIRQEESENRASSDS